jgi:hypothetical protein
LNADDSSQLSDGSESDEDARADALSDIGIDDREPAGKILMGYFRAIVAWNQAYVWLNSSMVFWLPKGVMSLNIVKIQVPKQQKQATSIRAILDEYLQEYNYLQLAVKESIKNLEKIGDKPKGTVHAEAILMALIKKCSNAETTLPPNLVHILKVIHYLLFNCVVC